MRQRRMRLLAHKVAARTQGRVGVHLCKFDNNGTGSDRMRVLAALVQSMPELPLVQAAESAVRKRGIFTKRRSALGSYIVSFQALKRRKEIGEARKASAGLLLRSTSPGLVERDVYLPSRSRVRRAKHRELRWQTWRRLSLTWCPCRGAKERLRSSLWKCGGHWSWVRQA